MRKVWRLYKVKMVEFTLEDFAPMNGDIFIKVKDFEHFTDADYFMRDNADYLSCEEYVIKEIHILN